MQYMFELPPSFLNKASLIQYELPAKLAQHIRRLQDLLLATNQSKWPLVASVKMVMSNSCEAAPSKAVVAACLWPSPMLAGIQHHHQLRFGIELRNTTLA